VSDAEAGLKRKSGAEWSGFSKGTAPAAGRATHVSSGTPFKSAGQAPPEGGFVPGTEGFFDFGVVLLSVMAKAWENEQFAKLLVEDPTAGLNTVRGYKPPWHLGIEFRFDEGAHWIEGAETPWHLPTPHVLRLQMPAAPPAEHDWAVALAAYNSTGAEYPFTCCD
jgi:ribosomally synthesized peptide (two-chain TOMM family)